VITLHVYVDGSDLADLEARLVDRFSRFVASWGVSTARVVNARHDPSADLRDGDLPDWDLGLNFTVDRLARDKIADLVRFVSDLARETGRDFAVGSGGEDWLYIGPAPRGDAVELLAEQIG